MEQDDLFLAELPPFARDELLRRINSIEQRILEQEMKLKEIQELADNINIWRTVNGTKTNND